MKKVYPCPAVCPKCSKEFIKKQGRITYCSKSCGVSDRYKDRVQCIKGHSLADAVTDGKRRWCRTCLKQRTARYKTKPYARITLLNAYGLTRDDYRAMFESQGGQCPICTRDISPIEVTRNGKKNLRQAPVDHDHETGLVRGILCAQCNSAIGLLGENVATLYAAYEYIAANEIYGLISKMPKSQVADDDERIIRV